MESFYKVLQECRFLKSAILKVSCDFDIVFCMNDFYFIVDYPHIYNKDFSHKLYLFMFFVATKMGPHCKETQNHGKQRCVKMTHF